MILSDVCETRTGFTPRGRLDYVSDGRQLVQLGDFDTDGTLHPEALRSIAEHPSHDRFLAGPGDVLFRSRGARTTAWAIGDEFDGPVLVVSPVYILRPAMDLVDGPFLAWLLNEANAQRHFEAGARGTSVRMVPKSILDDLPVELPDLASQVVIGQASLNAAKEQQLRFMLADKQKAYLDRQLAERSRALAGINQQITSTKGTSEK